MRILDSVFIMTILCIVSCSGGEPSVSDGVKNVVVSKVTQGNSYKLPKQTVQQDQKDYEKTSNFVSFKVESVTKTEDWKYTVTGTVDVPDEAKLVGLQTMMAFSGSLERGLATFEDEMKKNPVPKNYKAKSSSKPYTVVYSVKDGVETVESVTPVKSKTK